MPRTLVAALLVLSWSGFAWAQPPYGARTMTTLDDECIAREVAVCVAEEYRAPAYLPGQTLPTLGGEPCVDGRITTEQGGIVGFCDYNPTLHRNTSTVSACELRVRADPPPQCEQQVLTAQGAEELVREALQAQAAALREAFYVHCRASARRPADCEPLRPR